MQASDFINAIREHPFDYALKLVYADWLDDQGDPLGELIRVEVEMTTAVGPQFAKLRRRADELRMDMGVPPRIETCPACLAGEGQKYQEGIIPSVKVPVKCKYCGGVTRSMQWYHPILQVIIGDAKWEGEDIAKRLEKNLKRRRKKLELQKPGG